MAFVAPQVASLSELSRIRGDAEVRYPYAETEPKLTPLGLDGNGETAARMGGGGKRRRKQENKKKMIFFFFVRAVERERAGERRMEEEE